MGRERVGVCPRLIALAHEESGVKPDRSPQEFIDEELNVAWSISGY